MRGILMLLVGSAFALAQTSGDPSKKLPIPDKAAQAKAFGLVMDVFKDDIKAAANAEAKSKLALTLLQQGKDSRDDAATRYVLYREARALAAKAGDATLTLLAVDEMTRAFNVNPLELKASALAEVAENVTNQESGKNLVDLVMPLIAVVERQAVRHF